MLALICGQGSLPRIIADAQEARPFVCVLDGFEPDGLYADLTFRLETLGTALKALKAHGVREICLCGAIRRPRVDPTLIDAATAPLVPKLQDALTKGDDGALRVVMQILEEAGFTMVSAHDLTADLLPEAGVPTTARYTPDNALEARLGQNTVAAMGARDAGQACVVRGDVVVAREDAAGTDAMLMRLVRDRQALEGGAFTVASDFVGGLLQDTAEWFSGAHDPAQGGILFKAPKPGQDRRADLPVIGPATADAVAAAGLAGIVVEAGGVMVLNQPELIERLNAHGLFLWVRDRDG